jgi:hypothetical protein
MFMPFAYTPVSQGIRPVIIDERAGPQIGLVVYAFLK